MNAESNTAASGQPPWIGRVLDDRYRIVELLGEGGMGAVFVAEHLKLHKQVAVKIIRAEFAEHSQAAARFAREALATAQIDYPHVASAIDFGHLPEGSAYLVIQLVRGESLARRISRGTLGWSEVCELGAQVADALAAAHDAGIIHRDLKPDNILLEQRRDGSLHAKVVDFGIAHLSGELGGAVVDASQPITRMGAVIGTPGYMAPEQAMGGTIDARVDLYALGVILWECCTGQPLWEAETLTELFTAQLTRPAPDLRAGLPDVPEGLAALLDRLLARSPAQRPTAALPVRDTLRALARAAADHKRDPSASASAGRSNTATLGGAATSPFTTAADTGAGRPRRGSARARPWLILGVLAALVVALLLATRGEPPANHPTTPEPTPSTAPAAPPRPRSGPLPARRELLAEVPKDYLEHARALLISTEPAERAAAGRAIAGAPETATIPEYLREIAALERADECADKRAVLLRMEQADDIRVLWALRILHSSARDGCRSGRSRRDCLACLRDDLARVTAGFEPRAG